MKKKPTWPQFTTPTNVVGAYAWDDDKQDYRVKLVSKVPRGFLGSCLNDIGFHFDEEILPTLDKQP